jgi:hypothetical protein
MYIIKIYSDRGKYGGVFIMDIGHCIFGAYSGRILPQLERMGQEIDWNGYALERFLLNQLRCNHLWDMYLHD